MSRILILDNFFDNAEDLREFALSSRFFSHEEMSHKVGWRGFRTDELSGSSNYLFFRTCQKIKQKVSEFYNYDTYADKYYFYFHISIDDTKNSLPNFHVNKFHTDDSKFAGVVYLNPNAPNKTGTTIIVNEHSNDVDNKFNRLVAYPSCYTHAPTDLFGDTLKTGRLTLSFFIK